MEEKISQVFIDLAKENNLSNLTEITLKEYAKAFAGDVQTEEDLNDNFKDKHKIILTTMNGQLYKQNKDFDIANKEKYQRELDEYKAKNPVPASKKDEENPQIAEMQKQLNEMKQKEEQREREKNHLDLIKGIKSEFPSDNQILKKKFDHFVDNSNKIIDSEDAKTNFMRIKEAFEAHERIDLDNGRTRMSVGAPAGFDKSKYDKYFKKKETN